MKFALKLPSLPQRAPKAEVEADDTASEGSFVSRLLERKRLMRVAALLLVAGAAGQVVQSMNHKAAVERMAAAEAAKAEVKPAEIVVLSAEAPAPMEPAMAEPVVAPTLADATPSLPEAEMPAVFDETSPVMIAAAESAAMIVEPAAAAMPAAEEQIKLAAATVEAPLAPALPEALAAGSDVCPVTLDLAAVEGAMIGVTLIAPCAPNARVVLQHEGLAVTGLTTASGSLFTALPALTAQATIVAVMADGTRIDAQIVVAEAANFRRFGVQWQGDDAFQVNAYQNGASFGGEGHVYGVRPGLAADAGGFLEILGDPAAPMPLLAEIYTYPAAQTPVDLVVEAAVTDKTCGRELLGETLSAAGGKVVVTDLTLAMPDCTAIGDFLVLNNLAQDMTLAAK